MSVAKLVLILAWVSKFVMLWLWILRVVPRNDLLAWGFFLFFWIISLMTSAGVYTESRRKGNDSEG